MRTTWQAWLTQSRKKEIKSIDDIFNDDSLDILGGDSEGLFDFNHIPKETTMPDYIASRKPCKDFDKFESLFIECQSDLTNDSNYSASPKPVG